MPSLRLLVAGTQGLHSAALDFLKQHNVRYTLSSSPDLLKEPHLDQYDVFVVTYATFLPAALLDCASSLKAVVSCSAGLDHIDVAACEKKGIRIYHSPASNADAVAEHTLGLLFAVRRKIVFADRHIRQGQWNRDLFLSSRIEGSTLGIIGFGAIGKLVATKLAGLHFRVLVYDPYLTNEQVQTYAREHHLTITPVKELSDLLKQSDIVTIHVPLSSSTTHLIGKNELSLMKPTAIILNTSRGTLVDEQALIHALQTSMLAGAGLDVFTHEPVISSELKQLDTVVLTPHISAYTVEAREQMATMALQRFLQDFVHKT